MRLRGACMPARGPAPQDGASQSFNALQPYRFLRALPPLSTCHPALYRWAIAGLPRPALDDSLNDC